MTAEKAIQVEEAAPVAARKPTLKERATSAPPTRITPEGVVASPKPAAKAAAKPKAKLEAGRCAYGTGAYDSPVSMKKCGAPVFEFAAHPSHTLCATHSAAWKVASKKRAAAKKATVKIETA